MDVRQLRYFLTIAKCGSFSRAALELHVAQPALSQHVANLESELGVKLFDRSTKGVIPTECGETLMSHAEIILTRIAQAGRDVQNRSAQPSGMVSIGLPTSISLGLTVPLLTAVESRFPSLELKVSENHSGYLSEWVQSGRLDLAILFDIEAQSPFVAHHLLTEALYFVSAPGQFPSDQEVVELGDLANRPLILTGATHGLRQVIDRQAQLGPTDIWVKTEIDSLVAIKQLVTAGFGNSILPWCAIKEECDAGKLQALRVEKPRLERKVFLASARDWPQSRASQVVSDLVIELSDELIATGTWRGEAPKR